MKLKLTPPQLRVLRALNEPGAVAHYAKDRGKYLGSSRGPGWLLPHCQFAENSTMWVLVYEGFIDATFNDQRTITQAGKEALAALDSKEAP